MDYLAEVKEVQNIFIQDLVEQEQLDEVFDQVRGALKKAWDFVREKIDKAMLDKVQAAGERLEKRASSVQTIVSGLSGLRQAGELSKQALVDPSLRADLAEIGQKLRSEVNALLNDVDNLNSTVDKAIQDMQK